MKTKLQKAIEKIKSENDGLVLVIGKDDSGVEYFIAFHLNLGFSLIEKGYSKKYIIFGEKSYYALMQAGENYYREKMEALVEIEDYEGAAILRDKLKSNNK